MECSGQNRATSGTVSVERNQFEVVSIFNRVIINRVNDRSMEITNRVQADYWTYFRHKPDIKIKNIGVTTKMKIYKAAIQPVVTYAAETMWLTGKDGEKQTFPKKDYEVNLRKVKTENGEEMNFELKQKMKGEYIVRGIEAHKSIWYGHIYRKETEATIRRPVENRPEESPKHVEKTRPSLTWERRELEDGQ